MIPNASADFRRRIIQFAEGTKPEAHAVVLSHVAPWDPVRRGEWLTTFANRVFESPKQQKEAYTTLLKAGLVPPKTDAMRLMSLLESPPGPVDISFFASLIPLLPDGLAIEGIKALSHNAASLLLPLVLHRGIPITDATLHSFRENAINARPPLMSAWMLAATADALASDERANAAYEALELIRATPDSDWRKPHALLSGSRALPTPIRTEVEVEAWSLAAEIGLDKLGVTDFARLTLDLTPGGLMHATEILKRQAPSTRVRCLPSLIRNSIPELIPDQVRDLADATRLHGGYGDLAPCIDRVPSEQLMFLYDTCTELRIPTVSIQPDAPPPAMGSQGSRDVVPQTRFNPSRPPSKAEEFLKATGPKVRTDLSVAECASIFASADNFDVARLAQLIEALGPSLCQHFNSEEASELENIVALTLEIYR